MFEFDWVLVVKGCVWENIGKREFKGRSKMVSIMLMKMIMVAMVMVMVMMMMVIVMMVTMMMVMEPTRE